MRRLRSLLLVPASAALLAACQGPPAGDSYFPLESGHRWTYDVKTERENNTVEHDTLQMSTHGRDDIEGGAAWRRRSDSGVEYWLRSDETGIFRVATKSDLDAEPRRDVQRRYVLKLPLAVGTEWQAQTTAYLLARRQDFPREIRHTHAPVNMHYTIEAVGQALDTRAGSFKDCLRVRGKAAMRLFADPVVGWRDLPLTTVEWYCRGAGLVKLERLEPAESTFLSGGKLTMELTSWQ